MAKKSGKRKRQNSGMILIGERKNKILHLVKKGNFPKASLEIDKLKEKLSDKSELLSKTLDQLAGKIIAYEKKTDISSDADVLCDYGTFFSELGRYETAIEKFEQALIVNPKHVHSLSNYGLALSEIGRYEEAIEKYKQALIVNPKHVYSLNGYGNALVELGSHEEAIEKYKQALIVNPNHIEILNNYGAALSEIGRYEEAIEKYERALIVNPKHINSLNNYGLSLYKLGRYEEAIEKYERALIVNPKHVNSLNGYGNALAELGSHEKAIKKYERALAINPNHVIILNNYGNILAELGGYEEAIEKYEQALIVNPKHVDTLNEYGNALAKLARDEEAIEKYEQALTINPNYIETLISYTLFLFYSGQYDEAAKKLEKAKAIAPDDPVTLFIHAMLLLVGRKHEEAISTLLKIDHKSISNDNIRVLYLNLGRLYYLVKSEEEGNRYFQLAIETSQDKDAEKINVAQLIFADNPYSQEGIDILREIAKSSPMYSKAFEIQTLNLPSKDFYQVFHTHSETSLRDTEMLHRAIYHKMANEISIFKGIAHRIIYQSRIKDEILPEIIENIENIAEQIRMRRDRGQAETRAIPDNDYEKLMVIISETAHDISDFVNNELAAVESKIRRVMWKLPRDDSRYLQFEKLLEQLEFSQSALNDLKSVNEGIRIRYHVFRVKQLFEKWKKNPKIANATISLDIQNGEAEFDGDEEKIKSILSELVENSLKYNSAQTNLEMHITARDTDSHPVIRDRIPGQQRYLLIEFSDSGQGIAQEKKNRIFLPLETTSEEGEGSGLGLFIIRKTLNKMNGHIRETGQNGAKFEIHIPYPQEEKNEYFEGYRQYSSAVG